MNCNELCNVFEDVRVKLSARCIVKLFDCNSWKSHKLCIFPILSINVQLHWLWYETIDNIWINDESNMMYIIMIFTIIQKLMSFCNGWNTSVTVKTTNYQSLITISCLYIREYVWMEFECRAFVVTLSRYTFFTFLLSAKVKHAPWLKLKVFLVCVEGNSFYYGFELKQC